MTDPARSTQPPVPAARDEAIAPRMELTAEQQQFERIIRQISRALKPYGLLLCVTLDQQYTVEPDARDAMREALAEVKQRCEAYPATVFLEPDYEKARALLEAGGMTMDGLHGSWARHLLTDIGNIAAAALAASGTEPQEDKP